MARYPVSGSATVEVPPNTSTGATGVCTVYTPGTGRLFWCTGVTYVATGTSGDIEMYDATAQTTATGQTIRMLLSAATALTQLTPSVFKFASPGVKFSNTYVLAKLAASGSIAIGGLAVMGYEEE